MVKTKIIKKGRITHRQRMQRALRAYRVRLRDDMRRLTMSALRGINTMDPEARRVARNRRKARARKAGR